MKYLHLTLAITLALVVGAVPTYAATSTVEDATVNLYCRLTVGKKIFGTSGSGVFVSDRGIILTNAHVAQYFLMPGDKSRVKGECHVRTGSPAESTYTAEVMYFPSTWIDANLEALKQKVPKGSGEGDFALLRITGVKEGTMPERFPSLPLSFFGVAEGELVTVAGYPTDGRNFAELQNELDRIVTTTTVSNVRTFSLAGADLLTLASSTAAGAGVSGGPVVRADGTLTGIVVAKSATTLRAITPLHINNRLVADTGVSLPGMFFGDLAARAAGNLLLLDPKDLAALRQAFVKRNR
ncbi:MAG TPA: serine protease [Candidatus Paceibacterota bacterium]|nr:serine protease [Candidatus Paceibacterota bacterium]